ncbi:glycosyltransferase [Candidatus Woesearchaeota archaeon]|nr:glycosyltransferase [Candidatus Woesearchaeota archaeon]
MTSSQKDLRIAHFTDTFHPKIDGIVTFLNNSIDYFSRKNHNIIVFCPTYGKQKEKYFGKNVKIFRLHSIHLHTYKEVKIAIARPKKIFKELKYFHPDIIHIHSPGIVGLLGILAARKLHVPLIGTYHTLISEQTDYISLGNILGLNKLVGKLYTLFKKEKFRKKPKDSSRLKRLLWYISLKMYKKCDIIIAPSESIANLLKSKLRHNAIYHVCCGVSLKKFYPKKSYKHAENLSFVYVGRLSFEKNIDIIIKAFQILDKRGIDFSLKIVGDGPARKYLKGIVKRYGLESKIIFTGELYGDALKKIYRKTDVFVTASTMETLGMSILEALASGTPVIAARKYAVPDIVKDGVNGYLAEPYSAESFSEAVIEIIKNKSRIPHFGRQGVKIAQKCELERSMKRLESVYVEAMRVAKDRH